MISSLSLGIKPKYFIAVGNKTIPENTIRSDATWYADKLTSPSFINTKLLPQITDSIINMNQFKKPLFNFF